ncbi:tetraacyldisaccharide 4'-kinase [Salidesulfovibrio onnuriiensis]|uniref:tetraacyldisaccharide 4'-kinase n=1 Tax=Salidesulfovibrio onnuriiensis TaxID=2583823 RepID=UPI0011C8BB81|nr:tetraacyldisaccharide 4'-kinase [Salidesulfovibrio onnuriiensis]
MRKEYKPVEELQQRFRPLLAPAAWLNARFMRLRSRLYGRGILRQWEAPAVTVSIGNVSWGGTGKTPMTGWMLKWAANRGMEAGVLTRGYRARPATYPFLVQPGNLVEEAGDEPLMLAKEFPEARIIVDPVRSRGGKWLFEHYNPKLVVLDDGFQHMAVKRHVDIVLLRPSDLAQHWNRVIPSGSWREDYTALRRADCFMIKGSPEYFDKLGEHIRTRLEQFNRPVFNFSLSPKGFVQVLTGRKEKDFFGEPFLLVSGIGDPRQVHRAAIKYFNYKPVDHMVYRDHHTYTKTDVLDIIATARRKKAKYILCTQKDAVKLGPMCTPDFWAFDTRVDFGPSHFAQNGKFSTWWNRRFNNLMLEIPDAGRPVREKDSGPEDEAGEEHGAKD